MGEFGGLKEKKIIFMCILSQYKPTIMSVVLDNNAGGMWCDLLGLFDLFPFRATISWHNRKQCVHVEQLKLTLI